MATFGQGINPALGQSNFAPYLSGAMQGANSQMQGQIQGAQSIAAGLQQGVATWMQQQEKLKTQLGDLQATFAQNPAAFKNVDPDVIASISEGKVPSGNKMDSVYSSVMTQDKILQRQAAAAMAKQKADAEQMQAEAARTDAATKAALANAKESPEALDLQRQQAEHYRQQADYNRAQAELARAQAAAIANPNGKAAADLAHTQAETAQINATMTKKAAQEAQKKIDTQARIASTRADLGQTMQTVNEAINLVRDGTGGPISGLPYVRGIESVAGATGPKILSSKYDTIGAALTLDKLQEMKQLSSTGSSGLGQLSDREGAALRSYVAQLDPSLPRDAQLQNLLKIREHLLRLSTPSLPPGWSVSP